MPREKTRYESNYGAGERVAELALHCCSEISADRPPVTARSKRISQPAVSATAGKVLRRQR